MRVLLAGLFHETHAFLDEETPLSAFEVRRGEEMLACRGDGSPLAGVVETAERFGWTLVPAVDYRSPPSGTASDDVLEQCWADVRSTVEASSEPLDAIYLVLHGAMVTPRFRDVEGRFLLRIRSLPQCSHLPIFGVFDLHAHFSPAMSDFTQGLIAYRENPHTDAHAMAVYAAELLERSRRTGVRPRTWYRPSSIVWPPTGTGTADSPMRELEALARRIERDDPDVWAVNVVGGYAFGDTPHTGVSFSIVSTGDAEHAARWLDELYFLAWDLRHEGNKLDPPLSEVLPSLRNAAGLTVVAEPSDNIGGGAPGDGTGLLRAFIEHRIANAAVCINDPAAVAATQSLQPGERVRLSLGGKGSRLDPGPVELEVEFVSRSDGRFQLEDRQSHLASLCGDRFDMGPSAVVRHAGVTILITSRKTPPLDLGQWRSQGIDPAKLSVIGVKAAVAHRRAYDPIATQNLWVDTPGPCRSDLRSFPYQHLRRPIFPLD